MDEAKLTQSEVETLILKFLLARGESTGHNLADQIRLPFGIVDDLLQSMKQDQFVVHRGSAPMNDYVYQLTDVGRTLARLHAQHCTYHGSAPVDLSDYIVAVAAQSLTNQNPTMADLQRAFADLLINDKMIKRVGPAINSGRGLFLYGAPGNGKSSIAERVTLAFGEKIWIPRALGINGEVMRLYDPNHHQEQPLAASNGLLDERRIDKRWIRINRPTLIVGGELTMDNLEVTINTITGVSEAPIQLKSNCGTLVIDDFGRQRMSTDELLNRWIVPLERRHDFLNMANGKKIQVPFDQLIVFSTNLEPRELVDDAFLRRVPYKIEVVDPTEAEFRELFRSMAPRLGLECKDEIVDYLIATHYRPLGRPFRFCQPRDLLMQICNFCRFLRCPPEMTRESMDLAVENYFSVM
ncbi:MAG: AAA family ATPase [Planctomycetes bacterium RBG_16_64_10]|nr:MAG: AAA family ATPase [Planctomycetes bacterium RBG_16_64_10]